MNCGELRKSICLKMGRLFLSQDEKSHLDSCPGCTKYYEHLVSLEKTLTVAPAPSLTKMEFSKLQSKLDSRINKYHDKALNFYRLSFKYGATMAAILLLVFASFFGKYKFQDIKPADTDSLLATLTIAEDFSASGDEVIEEPYLDLVIDNYVDNYGFNTSEMLIGDLSDEELEYLKNKINAGDIL
jgi:hypothetical protein